MEIKRTTIKIIGIIGCFIATACLAQSFMNYGASSQTSSQSTAPTPGGKLTPMSSDDFKSAVNTLGKQNAAMLSQQAQQFTPPSSASANNANAASGSMQSSSSTSSTNSTTTTPNQSTQSRQPNYNGFGSGTTQPAAGGTNSGSGGFGIKY